MDKLIATAFATLTAYWLGPWAEHTFFWNPHDPDTARLYGLGSVFLVTWAATYIVALNVDGEIWFSIGFASLAAYWFGTDVGYHYWGVHDKATAAFNGGIPVFIVALLVGLVVVWPIARQIGNGLRSQLDRLDPRHIATRFRSTNAKTAQSAKSPAQLEAAISSGKNLTYEGQIDRDFQYSDNGRLKKERGRCRFTLTRNTMAMPPREREAVLIFEVLDSRNLLSPAQSDHIRHALTWGDGRCQSWGGPLTLNRQAMQGYGFKGITDVIAYDAVERNASIEGIISELFTLLQNAACQPNPHPDVLALYHRYAPPTQESGRDSFE